MHPKFGRSIFKSDCNECCVHFFSAVFNLFCSIQTFFSDFMAEINKKRLKKTKKLKTAEKSILTSFWVRAAPKSWLKYTTNEFYVFKAVPILADEPGLRLLSLQHNLIKRIQNLDSIFRLVNKGLPIAFKVTQKYKYCL